MKVACFTIPILFGTKIQEELNKFLTSQSILSVDREFVSDGQKSYWAFCITYKERGNSSTVQVKQDKVDYKNLLEESEFAIFAKLRTLRKNLASQEGVPVYSLFNNEQLADMVRHKVINESALTKINGVGEARVRKYGKAFLALLKSEFEKKGSDENHIALDSILEWNNLTAAAIKASRGKRFHPVVMAFFANMYKNLHQLIESVRNGDVPAGNYNQFTIRDPKLRLITVVPFNERVLHHAILNKIGWIFERYLITSTYACRKGKGPLKAVEYVQSCLRKYRWFVKIDIKRYFDSIDHNILLGILNRKFKGFDFIQLLERIIGAYSVHPCRGLPIGSLTSQNFANVYLAEFDRFVLSNKKVHGYARYMDDMVWFCDSARDAKIVFEEATLFLTKERSLEIKDSVQINKAHAGLPFCGFRVFPGTLKLTRRKMRNYISRRKFWEKLYMDQKIDTRKLQTAYDSVHQIISHADSQNWRRLQNTRFQVMEV